MKLIPPGTASREQDNETTTAQETPQRVSLVSLKALESIGTEFSSELESAVAKLQEQANRQVTALADLLRATTAGIRNIMGGGSAGNGRTGRNSAAGVGSGKRGRGRPRKADSGTADRSVTVGADGAAPKRGRGRPKGSKNKPKSGRGPGRPRKADSEPTEPARKPAGRKRGRPRKPGAAVKRATTREPKRAVKSVSRKHVVAKSLVKSGGKRVAQPRNSRGGGRKGRREAAAEKVAAPAAATAATE